MSKSDSPAKQVFSFFTEVGIINQLSSALLAATLPDGVHPSHFAIMNHLVVRGDGRTPIAIAGAMQVTKMTMTHSLKVLGDRNFITTAPNPEDARGKLVYLTEAGRTFREAAITRVTERFDGMLTPQVQAAMGRTMDDLRLIRQHLDNNR